MSSDQRREIDELYRAARESGVEALTHAKPELRREVERMLAASGDKIQASAVSGDPEATTITLLGPGAHLGPYRLEMRIGMGEVFRATDTRLGRAVAIKICRKQFSERFSAEARAISALNHPHICTLYDVGPNYLVMELVEGETLSAELNRHRIPIERVLRYGAQIADALAAAHAKGIIHRGLKPTNIMIAKGGVKVLDFGVAKVTASPDDTQTAPEIFVSHRHLVSADRKGAGFETPIRGADELLREIRTARSDGHHRAGNRPVIGVVDHAADGTDYNGQESGYAYDKRK